MTICLYGSPISTFARKVAIGLELKGLPYDLVDALTPDRREELRKLNPRLEVPVLTDGDLVVVNSSDILQYLDWRYPERPLYPAAIEERVVDAHSSGWAINASIQSWWIAPTGTGRNATTSRRPACWRRPNGISMSCSIISSARCCCVRSHGRSASPVSSNAPGLPTSPPCAHLASPSTSSAFPSSAVGFGRCGRIRFSSLIRSAPLHS